MTSNVSLQGFETTDFWLYDALNVLVLYACNKYSP